MLLIASIIFLGSLNSFSQPQQREVAIVEQLFRLRNEHKADSAALLYADTVLVYMKYMRNVPRSRITEADRQFWKAHPKNKFEITSPVQVRTVNGVTVATVMGREYLDGTSYKKERIEIRFDRNGRINWVRGYSVK